MGTGSVSIGKDIVAKILLVDDDPYWARSIVDHLQLSGGLNVHYASSTDKARSVLNDTSIDCILLDVMMPPSDGDQDDRIDDGYGTGLSFLHWLRTNYPHIPVIGVSARQDVREYFEGAGAGFIPKSYPTSELLRLVTRVVDPVSKAAQPRIFIVHGHDRAKTLELKMYLQNRLGFPEPVVLSELASTGKTIIEKFEDAAEDIDIAFALLTPDDVVEKADGAKRARQNVIFELGYFYGALRRRNGKVIVLISEGVDLPSDLSGVVYISIQHGIEAAGEAIRRELAALGWGPPNPAAPADQKAPLSGR